MSHAISAVVVGGHVDDSRSREFDVNIVPSIARFTLIALEPTYVDFWSDKLDIHGYVAELPLLNHRVVHFIIQQIAEGCAFAIIETDYFGGAGEQHAAVYHGDNEIMVPQSASIGPINNALRFLGVRRAPGRDEFETLGLSAHRSWGNLFERYWD